MKSIAFVESNFTGIDAIRSAARAGYKCYLITSDYKHLKSMLPHDIFEGFDECVEVVRVSDSNDFMVLTQAVSGLGTPISAIVTFSQFRTLVVAKVAKHLGLRGTNPEAISIALDKLAVREKMKQQKLPSISFSSLSNISRNPVPLPCILKPSRGHSSLGIRLIQNNTDLQTAKKNYEETGEDILVEEFLEGPLYSLETVTRSLGKHIAWGYSDRILTEDFIEIGATFPAIAPDYQAGCDLVFSTLDAIGFDFGACHTELIFTKCGPRIVEINPRAGGSGICRLIERAANRDILLDLLKLYLGISSDIYPVETQNKVSMRSILPSTSGRIFQLPGRSEILSQPGVRDLWYQRKIGELTDDSKSNFSWLLTVLTECTREKSSFENAALAADLASARTKIETSSLSDKRNSG